MNRKRKEKNKTIEKRSVVLIFSTWKEIKMPFGFHLSTCWKCSSPFICGDCIEFVCPDCKFKEFEKQRSENENGVNQNAKNDDH